MNRFKLFIENFLIYGIGGSISKIVPLIMLPIITRLMPNTFYFGLNELTNTVVSFGSAIAIMGMYDAMFRMFFDREDVEYKKKICSTALNFTFFTSFIIAIFIIVFRKSISVLIFSDIKYQNLVILSSISILIGSTNSIVAAPTRMENKRSIYLSVNILGSIISYTVALILLKMGYYILALPIGYLISVLSMEIFFFIFNKRWFQFKVINKKYIKSMLLIGLPLVPNFLIYWIFNSCDRIMIAKILGNEYTGIYGVGAKVAQISQMIYVAFSGGWQYFAFSTMKDKDQVELTSKIFEYLGLISFIAGMIIATLSELIFNIFFRGNYVKGSMVMPWLFLAPLIQMLYQVISNQFLVVKKTWPSMFILGSGMIFNILANLFFIPKIGVEGAALATLGGYILSLILCTIVLTRIKLIRISFKFYLIVLLTVSYFCIWRFCIKNNIILSMILDVIISMIQIYLYKEIFIFIMRVIKKSLGREKTTIE